MAERTHFALPLEGPKGKILHSVLGIVLHVQRASDTWLAARINDGHGSRSMQIQNFHWKVKNAFDLEALKEFQGHIGRLEQVC